MRDTVIQYSCENAKARGLAPLHRILVALPCVNPPDLLNKAETDRFWYTVIMKIVHKQNAEEHRNGKNCIAREYPLGDKDINGAVVTITGRYPETGFAVNEVCKELIYIVRGKGIMGINGEEQSLQQGDLVLLLPSEKYYFSGDMEMFVSCTPAWFAEQHKTGVE